MTTATENQITETAKGDEPGAETEAEFDQAFDELVAAKTDSPSTDAETGKEAPSAPPATNEAEPGSDESRSKEEAAAQPAPASGEDIWANADPTLKAAYQAAIEERDHRLRSVTGRVSALDRELSKLRSQPQGGGGQEPAQQSLKTLLESDKIKTIRDEYPDLGPVLDTLASVAERVDQVGTTVETATATTAEAAQETALTDKVPNWVELAGNAEFQPWLAQQPRHVREAAARNWDGIVDAEEAADVFERFATLKGLTTGDQGGQQGGGGGGAPSRRERQQQGSKAASVAGPAAQAAPAEDYDAAFDAEVARRERERSRSR